MPDTHTRHSEMIHALNSVVEELRQIRFEIQDIRESIASLGSKPETKTAEEMSLSDIEDSVEPGEWLFYKDPINNTTIVKCSLCGNYRIFPLPKITTYAYTKCDHCDKPMKPFILGE